MKQTTPLTFDTESVLKCELAAEVLRSFGSLRFAATGWSMLPSIWPGETLVVERVDSDQVRVGDVVLVEREGGLRAHRVIDIAGDPEHRQWTTQGDALPVPDRVVAQNELLGQVTHLIREGKLIAVPSKLTATENLMAMVIQRSQTVARAFVYLNSARYTSRKSVFPCKG